MTTQYGYIRVSSKEQNEDRQLIAMQKQNIPEKNIPKSVKFTPQIINPMEAVRFRWIRTPD